MTHPMAMGQQLYEILIKSNITVVSYGPDKDYGFVCSMTLSLEICHLVKVMTHPWVMGNNCVEYYLNPTEKLSLGQGKCG